MGLSAVFLASTIYVGTASAAPKKNVEANEVDCDLPCIDSGEIVDATITEDDLAFDPATQAELDAIDPAPLTRVVYVSDGGISAADNGTELLAAIGAIGSSGECPTPPSATDPCLVKLGPGVFDIGATTLATGDYTNIEGSGQGTTVITGTGIGPGVFRLVQAGANTEIRNLTVENTNDTDPPSGAIAIGNTGGNNVRISHATVLSLGSTTGGAIEIAGPSTGVIFTHVTAEGVNLAISVGGSAVVEMSNVTAKGKFGLFAANSSVVTVRNSTIEGVNDGVLLSGTPEVNIYSSRIINDVDANGGTATISGSHVTGDVEAANADVDVHSSVIVGDVTHSSGTLNLAVSQLTGLASGATVCFSVYDAGFTARDAACQP